ncbi:MAG: DUF2933 domain-containing protein [Chloroflexi bacterium]|nr:DUF2933 domain-containing protein [Chloroflexota bacterium]
MAKRHMLIMLACCLIPIVALAAIFVFKIPANSVVYFGILLLCPALHLLMMRNMGHGHADHDHAGHGPVAQLPQPKSGGAVTTPALPAGEKQG